MARLAIVFSIASNLVAPLETMNRGRPAEKRIGAPLNSPQMQLSEITARLMKSAA